MFSLEKLQASKLFWSYDISKKKPSEVVIIEQILKFGDVAILTELFGSFNKKKNVSVWQSTMQNDNRFVRQNYYLLKFFLTKIKPSFDTQTRASKLKELAAKH